MPAHGQDGDNQGKGLMSAIDRVGGKLIYRLVSVMLAIMAALFAYGAWSAFSASESGLIPGCIMLATSLACCWAIRWCWSPDRRLSEIE